MMRFESTLYVIKQSFLITFHRKQVVPGVIVN
jgi:hypothetical protein